MMHCTIYANCRFPQPLSSDLCTFVRLLCCPTTRTIAMAGLRETFARLAQLRRRVDGLLKSAPQHSKAAGTIFKPTLGAGRLREVAGAGSNPGGLRMLTYTPRDLPRVSPLVVALHGCTQTAAAYDHSSGWSTLADRHGFALLLPEQQFANNPNTCFSWFQPADTQRDHGEALSIWQMIERMIRDHSLDRSRVFIVGLSAGGAMTASMLAAYPEVFAGGAIIAGLPHGAAATVQAALQTMAQGSDRLPDEWGDRVRAASPHRGPWPKLSVWHGSADHIVNPRNAQEIVKQWTNVHGLSAEPDVVHHVRGHSRRVWRDEAGGDVLEAYVIAGMGHGVPLALADGADHCGHTGAFHFDVGLSSSMQIATFWGIAADRPTMSDGLSGAPASGTRPRVPDRPMVGALPVAAARTSVTDPIALELEKVAGTDESGSAAHGHSFEPREFITAALLRAGLVVPPGSKPTGDPRSIISDTLRSVGLLKE
jgi:poly(hydroxyalkanoate) depolymerase family esterase